MITPPPLPGAIALPDGCWIRGRGLRHPTPNGPTPDFALYLGSHRADPPWPRCHLPRDRREAIASIHALHDRAHAGERVEVACGGGIGRTGTVIACLAVLAGVPATEAVAWTRGHYHRRAVETPWQRHWVTHFPVTG